MAENTKIEWCHHTFNHVRGCTKVSPGCEHCYAETMSGRNHKTLGVWGPNGTRVVAAESYWRLPLKWDKAARDALLTWEVERWQNTATPKPERPRVFCASLADVFEDWQGPIVDAGQTMLRKNRLTGVVNRWPGPSDTHSPLTMADVRARLFKLIDATPNLDWLLLTKRPENVQRMLPRCNDCVGLTAGRGGVPADFRCCHCAHPNLWLGTSVENREHGLPRLDILRGIPAAVRFLSIEPLLEDLGTIDLTGIHWVIVGGESGHGARPCHPDWVRSIRDQCQAVGVPFFFKQWGEWAPQDQLPITHRRQNANGSASVRVGKAAAGRLLDGREWDEFPRVTQ